MARPRVLIRWIALLALSAVLTALAELGGLPAAFLLGPMIAGIVIATVVGALAVPKSAMLGAQALIGCLIAASIEPELFVGLIDDWPILLGATLATMLASAALGGVIARLGILPGTTAIWGSAPGAASAMVLMSDAFGADVRLVAFMQYVRVVLVSITAAAIAWLFVDMNGGEATAVDWFPPIDWPAFGTTLGIAVGGTVVGKLSRLPAGVFLGPLVLGLILHAGFGLPLQLPPWLLAAGYAFVGWSVGLRFDRAVLATAARSLPQVMLAVVALIAFCGGVAFLLARYLGIDPLTAYLATSPGGMDTVAIIAAASGGTVDIAFVMAMQMTRFLIVILFGPPIARWIAQRA